PAGDRQHLAAEMPGQRGRAEKHDRPGNILRPGELAQRHGRADLFDDTRSLERGLGHRRDGPAGLDQVDPGPGIDLDQLVLEAAHEPVEAGLADRVLEVLGLAEATGGRADQTDARAEAVGPRPVAGELGGEAAARVDGPKQVDVEHLADPRWRELVQRLVLGRPDPGVGDHHVDPTKALARALEQRIEGGRLAQIRAADDRSLPPALQTDQILELVDLPVGVQDQIRALLREREGDRLADASRGAGDQDRETRKLSVHGSRLQFPWLRFVYVRHSGVMSKPPDHAARMVSAHRSLLGLSVGDAFGERFFVPPIDIATWLSERRVGAEPPWRWTDDTAMAIAIVEILDELGTLDPDPLAERLAERYWHEPWRGYGGSAHRLFEVM